MKKTLMILTTIAFGIAAQAEGPCAHTQIAASTPFSSSVAKTKNTATNTAKDINVNTGSGTK